MRVIDSSCPITFGARCEGECFKRSDDFGRVYMKIHPLSINSRSKVNAINLSTGTLVCFEDDSEVLPVKGTVTIENY